MVADNTRELEEYYREKETRKKLAQAKEAAILKKHQEQIRETLNSGDIVSRDMILSDTCSQGLLGSRGWK